MATKTLKINRLTETVGAEVLDVDVDRMIEDPQLPASVLDALEENGVLVFPGLHITDEVQVEFCRKMGDVVPFPQQKIPEVFVVTLEPEKNALATYLKGTVYWHVDDTMNEIPSRATMLSAKVLSASGGETEFASTYTAYDELSGEEKERFASLRVHHSQIPVQTLVHEDPTPEQLEKWRSQWREHPLVWSHGDGRRSLVIGQTAEYVVDMDPDESRTLLDDLLARATRPEAVYRHEWSEGDTVFWNNHGVLHRVMPYDADSRREMHRSTLAGSEPIQ